MNLWDPQIAIIPTKRDFDGKVVYRWELRNGLSTIEGGHELSESSARNAANRALKYLAQYPASFLSSL